MFDELKLPCNRVSYVFFLETPADQIHFKDLLITLSSLRLQIIAARPSLSHIQHSPIHSLRPYYCFLPPSDVPAIKAANSSISRLWRTNF